MIAQLRDLGLRPEDLSTVIVTHRDPDHAGHHDDFLNAAFVIQHEARATARAGDKCTPALVPVPTGTLPACTTAKWRATPNSYRV